MSVATHLTLHIDGPCICARVELEPPPPVPFCFIFFPWGWPPNLFFFLRDERLSFFCLRIIMSEQYQTLPDGHQVVVRFQYSPGEDHATIVRLPCSVADKILNPANRSRSWFLSLSWLHPSVCLPLFSYVLYLLGLMTAPLTVPAFSVQHPIIERP